MTKKITDLDPALPLTGAEVLPLVQNVVTRRSPLSALADWVLKTYQGFLPAGTGAVARTVAAKLGEVVSVKDFGAVGDGVADDTAAINSALAAHTSAFVPPGVYRIDGTVTINSNKNLLLAAGSKLIRMSAYSASTAPVVHLRGNYARLDGGSIESQNNSPNGVVALGHLNHDASNWNSLFWRFSNCDVFAKDFGGAAAAPYPGLADGIGVYIPSSQPNLGSSYANYFGEVSNVRVYNATVAWYLTDLANSHTFVNCTVEFFYWRAFQLNGAYGNTFYGGFINGCYSDGKIAILLDSKSYPGAPHASSLNSMWNHIYGSTIELYTADMIGVQCNSGNQGNFIQFSWNSVGTTYVDGDGSNTIVESRVAQYPKLATNQIDGIGAGQTQEVFIAPKFMNGTVYGIRFSGGGEVIPNVDNAINLGKAAYRFGTVYAATGTINTSDAREKQLIREVSDSERAVAVRLKSLIRAFKFSDAVAQKGGGARIHFGVIAQDVASAFEAEGLSASDYALLCFDEWDAQSEVRDQDGDLVQAARAAGNRYGVRYEELLAFIISAL